MADNFDKKTLELFGAQDSESDKNLLEDLKMLESELKSISVPAMTQNEAAEFYAELDNRLDRVDRPRGWLYQVTARYGAVFFAMVVLIGISFISGVQYADNSEMAADSDNYYYDVYTDQIAVVEDLDEEYIDMIVSSQAQAYGYDTSENLLGDLSDDELQMLEESFDVGAIL